MLLEKHDQLPADAKPIDLFLSKLWGPDFELVAHRHSITSVLKATLGMSQQINDEAFGRCNVEVCEILYLPAQNTLALLPFFTLEPEV